MGKTIFIAWISYHRRSEILAQHLGATLHFISYGQRGNPAQTLFRYLVQAWQTWRTLRSEQPGIVFVQNPPIFCVLVVYLYSRCYGARYVIDSHTGAFLSPTWRWSIGLHRLLSHAALTTIVHNKAQERIVERWGCRYCVIGFTPGDYPDGEPFPLGDCFNIAVISSFAGDEPLDVVFEAARRLPAVYFYVTGDSRRVASDLLALKPENCCLTGYLSYEQYVGLLRGANAILALTTDDNTLLMAAFEAVSLGTPLIVSAWPILQDYFSLGTVHIPNTVEGICEGVRQVQREQVVLQCGMLRLRQQLQAEWEQKFANLQRLLQAR